MFKPVKQNLHGLVSEAHPDFDKLASPEEKAAVARSKKTANMTSEQAQKELGATPEIRARFKIEIMFGEKRTTNGPNKCGISLWESGKRFHGGGDSLMYWCMDTLSNEGCRTPIPEDYMKGPFAMCPGCNRTVLLDRAASMRVPTLTTRKLAEEISKLFRTLGSSADIYVKYHKTDIHYLAMERAKGSGIAKRLKGMHIYPLKNIVKDTAFGADLTDRIYAFLTA